MEEVSAKRIMIGVLALLPLVFSLAWLISLMLTKYTLVLGQQGIMLSPVQNIRPIIVSLSLFMSGYVTFLVFIFSENIRRIFKGIGKKK